MYQISKGTDHDGPYDQLNSTMSKHKLWDTIEAGAWRLYLQWSLHLCVYCSHAARYTRWTIKKSCFIDWWLNWGHNFWRPDIVDTSPKREVLRSVNDLHRSKEWLVKRWIWFSSHWGHLRAKFAASKKNPQHQHGVILVIPTFGTKPNQSSTKKHNDFCVHLDKRNWLVTF